MYTLLITKHTRGNKVHADIKFNLLINKLNVLSSAIKGLDKTKNKNFGKVE